MNAYLPERIREHVEGMLRIAQKRGLTTSDCVCELCELAEEIDRWIANHDREVSEKAQREGARIERERLASLAESLRNAHDVAESAGYVEGETGRQECISEWLAVCDEPDTWLRSLADDPDWLNGYLFEAWEEGHSWGWANAQEAHDVRQHMDRAEWRLRTPNPHAEESCSEL